MKGCRCEKERKSEFCAWPRKALLKRSLRQVTDTVTSSLSVKSWQRMNGVGTIWR